MATKNSNNNNNSTSPSDAADLLPSGASGLAGALSGLGMRVIKAGDPFELPAGVVPHSITTAIYSPMIGNWGMALGTGVANPDTLALLLTANLDEKLNLSTARERELDSLTDIIRERIDQTGLYLRDPSVPDRVMRELFPSVSASISQGQVVTTARAIQKAVTSVLGNDAETVVVQVISELITHLMAKLRLVAPSTPVVLQEQRACRYPSLGDLIIEGLRYEITEQFEKVPLTVDVAGTKFSPTILGAQMSRTLANVAAHLLQTGNASREIVDALKLVKQSFVLNPDELRQLELRTTVMSAPAMLRLRADATILSMLENIDSADIATQDFLKEKALATTEKVISRSKRFVWASLAEAVGHISFTPVVDEFSNLRGGVISPRVTFTQDYRVGLWYNDPQVARAGSFNRLHKASEMMGQVIGNPAGGGFSDTAHDLAVSLLSQSELQEITPVGASPDLSVLVAYGFRPSDLDRSLELYAMHVADSVYVHLDDVEGGSDDALLTGLRIVYGKATRGTRLYAQDTIREGQVYSTDPAAVILLAQPSRGKLSLETKNQLLPERLYDELLLGDRAAYARPVRGAYTMKFAVAKTTYSVPVRPLELLGMEHHETAVILRQVLSSGYLAEYLVGLLELADWVIEHSRLRLEDGSLQTSDAAFERLVRMQAAHAVYQLMKERVESEPIKAVSSYVLRKLLGTIEDRATRERALPSFRRKQYQLTAAFRVYLYFLHVAGLLGEDEAVMHRLIDSMRKSEFFEMVTATTSL